MRTNSYSVTLSRRTVRLNPRSIPPTAEDHCSSMTPVAVRLSQQPVSQPSASVGRPCAPNGPASAMVIAAKVARRSLISVEVEVRLFGRVRQMAVEQAGRSDESMRRCLSDALDMHHRVAPRQHDVRDQPAMALPPQGLGAHDGSASDSGKSEQ